MKTIKPNDESAKKNQQEAEENKCATKVGHAYPSS
jgi:hypothetical protein